jgi:hypothetical protein
MNGGAAAGAALAGASQPVLSLAIAAVAAAAAAAASVVSVVSMTLGSRLVS